MDLPGSQEASPRLWPEFPDEVEGREEARALGSLPSSCRVGHILLDAAAILWLKCYVRGAPPMAWKVVDGSGTLTECLLYAMQWADLDAECRVRVQWLGEGRQLRESGRDVVRNPSCHTWITAASRPGTELDAHDYKG